MTPQSPEAASKMQQALTKFLDANGGRVLEAINPQDPWEDQLERFADSWLAELTTRAELEQRADATVASWQPGFSKLRAELLALAQELNGSPLKETPPVAKPRDIGTVTQEFLKFADSQGWECYTSPMDGGLQVSISQTPAPAALDRLVKAKGISLLMLQCEPDDALIQSLTRGQFLGGIWISNSSVTDAGIAALAKLPNLEHVAISAASSVTDQGLSPLAQLPHLKKLSLVSMKLDGQFLEAFSNSGLEQLELSSIEGLTTQVIHHLGNMDRLNQVDLSVEFTDPEKVSQALQELATRPLPRRFELPDQYVDDDVFIAFVKQGWHHPIRRYPDDPTPENALGVKELSFYPCQLSDRAFEEILDCVNLEVLRIDQAPITDKTLHRLKSFPKLRHLSMGETRFSAAGLASLTELPLKHLFLTSCEFDEAMFQQLGKITSLESLYLGKSKFDPSWLRHLNSLPQLQTLSLYDSSTDDQGLESLLPLPRLREINIRGTQVTAHANAILARFPHLSRIDAYQPIDPKAILKHQREMIANLGPQRPEDRVIDVVASDQAFAAIKQNGQVVAWGRTEAGGDCSTVAEQLQSGVKRIVANEWCFAALKDDGSVVAWGGFDGEGHPGDRSRQLSSEVVDIVASRGAFAALKQDGSVVAWGDDLRGGDASEVQSQLNGDVVKIHANGHAFVAIKRNGLPVAWGPADLGGDLSAVATRLEPGLQAIQVTTSAFAALMKDGQVVTWGEADGGGDSSKLQPQLQHVKALASTSMAFAALREDGSVVTWGSRYHGGESEHVADKLQSGVVSIVGGDRQFIALKQDGSVVCWADPDEDFEDRRPPKKLASKVQRIFALGDTFVAIRQGGELVFWGRDIRYAWVDEAKQKQLDSGVVDVTLNRGAVAMLKSNGRIVTVGVDEAGGNSLPVAAYLAQDVEKVVGNGGAFAALTRNGVVITWGHEDSGGDSSRVSAELNRRQISSSSN